jgi:hypothetical protein
MISKDQIQSLIGEDIAPYVYNSKNFIPGETSIYYSGPYWDHQETEAAVNSLLNGRWVTSV